MPKAIGLYVHIPFCTSKCHYCAFSIVTDSSRQQEYIRALQVELQERIRAMPPNEYIDTVYIGGGTPSLLEPTLLGELMQSIFALCPEDRIREISIECNPEQVTPAFLQHIQQLGITRVSMGIQTLDDKTLRTFNRKHTSKQALSAMQALHESNFNWNADIILGLPGTTPQSTLSDIQTILRFAPKHFSAYFLSVEPGTVLSQMHLPPGNEESLTKLYHQTRQILLASGFEQVEISNWAQPESACEHNLHYWHADDYLGIGLGASSLYQGGTFTNTKNLELYLQHRFLLEKPLHLDREDRLHLLLTTLTRTQNGLPWDKIQPFCDDRHLKKLKQRAEDLTQQGFCITPKSGIRLSPTAYPLHETIISSFLTV